MSELQACLSCGKQLYWDDQDWEWICSGCGDVYTDDELEEERTKKGG